MNWIDIHDNHHHTIIHIHTSHSQCEKGMMDCYVWWIGKKGMWFIQSHQPQREGRKRLIWVMKKRDDWCGRDLIEDWDMCCCWFEWWIWVREVCVCVDEELRDGIVVELSGVLRNEWMIEWVIGFVKTTNTNSLSKTAPFSFLFSFLCSSHPSTPLLLFLS